MKTNRVIGIFYYIMFYSKECSKVWKSKKTQTISIYSFVYCVNTYIDQRKIILHDKHILAGMIEFYRSNKLYMYSFVLLFNSFDYFQ